MHSYIIRESTTSRGAGIVTVFTLLASISLDPLTVVGDSYKARRRRTAVDNDQQGCLPYSDAPQTLVDPVWVQDGDDDRYQFSCVNGAFLVGAEPTVMGLSYYRRSVTTDAKFIQSVKWTCSDGVESEISDNFSTKASSTRTASGYYPSASFNVSITGVSARYSPYPSCVTTGGGTVSKDFCYHVGRLIFTGYEYDDDSNTAAGISFGPFGDDDFFNDPMDTPDAFSECGANEFATGVTTWEDSLGLSAIRLECAEYEAKTCVPPNLGGRGVTYSLEMPVPPPRDPIPLPIPERLAPASASSQPYPDPSTHDHVNLDDDFFNDDDGNEDKPVSTACGAADVLTFVAWLTPAGVMMGCLVMIIVQKLQGGDRGGAAAIRAEVSLGNAQQNQSRYFNDGRGGGGVSVSGVGGNWSNAKN